MDIDNYTKICTIEVDISHFSLKQGEKGQYFRLDYDSVLLFGMTEFKAQVAWRAQGVRVLCFLHSPCLILIFGFVFLCGRALRNGKPRVLALDKRICLLIWWNRSPTKIVYDP